MRRGQAVTVTTAATAWPATFLSVIRKTDGGVRFVVEDIYGRVFIQQPSRVTPRLARGD